MVGGTDASEDQVSCTLFADLLIESYRTYTAIVPTDQLPLVLPRLSPPPPRNRTASSAASFLDRMSIPTFMEYRCPRVLGSSEKCTTNSKEWDYNPQNIFPGSPWNPTWTPNAVEPQGKVQPLSAKVLADWKKLQKIAERHSDVLEKRWMKKTKKKQRDILLEACPKMSPSHRPDFEAYRQENTGQYLKGLSRSPEAYLWPNINLQDLSSKSLPIFINSRARTPTPQYLCTSRHRCSTPSSSCTCGSGTCFSPRVYTVYGWRVSEYVRKYPVLPGAPTPAAQEPSAENEILPTLAAISAEALYRVPAQLDLERIRNILTARRSAAEDHLWALREDPGYFADTVKDWSEHRNDRLLDTRGEPHPTGPHTTDFWERVIRNVIGDAYSGFMTWDLLHNQIHQLCALERKYKHDILYERQLPEEY
ncbi:hypothetical protein DL98DRAFT_530682 [Cadophora sp. DSE1049]|nr:hypothetical protein DL98DRAFT_530682 [Cadophora sp. DSE1049]